MKKVINTKSRVNEMDLIVANNLKEKRIFLDITQKELGDLIGVSIHQIQKYENGKNRISSGKLYAFAKFLKVPLNYFFNEGLTESVMEYNGETIFTIDKATIFL